MKKIILAAFLFVLLINLKSVTSLSVDSCKSGNTSWECELGKTCTCTISGNCTGGNLLVYKTNITNILCIPNIYNSSSEINWDNCGNPLGEVKVFADCEEGQSTEKTILVSSGVTTKTASLFLVPSSQSYNIGDTFPVEIRLNTNNNPVVAVSAYLNFDTTKLEVVSINSSGSAFSIEAEQVISGNQIKISRGQQTPGVTGSNVLIAKVNFRTKLSGTTNVNFALISPGQGPSRVVLDDGFGTDILKNVTNGVYTIGTTTTTSTAILTTTTIITTTTTTTLLSTTTTSPVLIKQPCPYVCCVGEENYRTRECPSNFVCCPDNTCRESCEAEPREITTSRLILWIVLVIIIPILAFLWQWWQASHARISKEVP